MNPPSEPLDLLEKAITILREHCGGTSEFDQDLDRLIKLHQNWNNFIFRVGFIGITDSGKSTLLNALLGEELLPTAARPTSNVLVSCRNSDGRPLRCRVRYSNGQPDQEFCEASKIREALALLADENTNPANKNCVTEIEIFSPHLNLPSNVALIDSPGLDSVNGKEHEIITMGQLLPTVDLVTFLFQHKSNPGEKLKEFLGEINRQKKPLVLLITHADGIAPKLDRGIENKSLQTVIGEHKTVVRKHLESAGLPADPIPLFLISVTQPESGNSAQSEIPEFLDCVHQLIPKLTLQREESRRMVLRDELLEIVDGTTALPEIEDLPSFIEQRRFKLINILEELTTVRRDQKAALKNEVSKAHKQLSKLRAEIETHVDARTHLHAAERIAKEAKRTIEKVKKYLLKQVSAGAEEVQRFGMELQFEVKPLELGGNEFTPTPLIEICKSETFVNEEDPFAGLRRMFGGGVRLEEVLDAKNFQKAADKFFQQQKKWLEQDATKFALRRIDLHSAGLKREIRRQFDQLDSREAGKASCQVSRSRLSDALAPLLQEISDPDQSPEGKRHSSLASTRQVVFEDIELSPLTQAFLKSGMRIAKAKKIALRNKALELSAQRVGARAREHVLLVGFDGKSFQHISEIYWHDFAELLDPAKGQSRDSDIPFWCRSINLRRQVVTSPPCEDLVASEGGKQPKTLFLIVNPNDLAVTMDHIQSSGIRRCVNRKCGVVFMVLSGIANLTEHSFRKLILSLSEMAMKFNLPVDAVLLDEEHSFFSTVFDAVFQKVKSGSSIADERALLRSVEPKGNRQQHFLNCGVAVLREMGQKERFETN